MKRAWPDLLGVFLLGVVLASCSGEDITCNANYGPGQLPTPTAPCSKGAPVCVYERSECSACTSDYAEMGGDAPCPKRNPICVLSGVRAGECCGQDNDCV